MDQFRIGFWNYVDCGILQPESAAEDWHDLGLNLAMSSEMHSACEKERSHILRELDACEMQGIALIVCDCRVHWRHLMQVGEAAFRADVAEAAADFAGHAAFWAFHVGDEPLKEDWPALLQSIAIVKEYARPFVNFIPMFEDNFEKLTGVPSAGYSAFLSDTVKKSGLPLLSYDCYAQCRYYFEEFGIENYFYNLNQYRLAAENAGVPFWTTLLSVGHWHYRVPTEDDLRWQLSTAVAHGAKGLLWFYLYGRYKESSYRESPFDLYYKKTEMYGRLRRTNRIFMDYYAGRIFSATLQKVWHTGRSWGGTALYTHGDIPGLQFSCDYRGELILSRFASSDGDFTVIVNNRQRDIERVQGSIFGQSFDEWLAPGQMFLLQDDGKTV